MLLRVALLLGSASALRVQPPALRPTSANRASSFALALPLSQLLVPAASADFFDELGKPPIELNPFVVNPSGYVFIGLYVAYLAWSIFRFRSSSLNMAFGRLRLFGSL